MISQQKKDLIKRKASLLEPGVEQDPHPFFPLALLLRKNPPTAWAT